MQVVQVKQYASCKDPKADENEAEWNRLIDEMKIAIARWHFFDLLGAHGFLSSSWAPVKTWKSNMSQALIQIIASEFL